jgi:hypothetical protein
VDFWHQHTHTSPDSAKALYLTHLQDTPAARPPPRKSAPPKVPFPTRSAKAPHPTPLQDNPSHTAAQEARNRVETSQARPGLFD